MYYPAMWWPLGADVCNTVRQGAVHGNAIENQVHDSSLNMKTNFKDYSRTNYSFQGQRLNKKISILYPPFEHLIG